MLKAGGVKTKPAYPIVSCRGKVCLPEDTKQTVFGRATSPYELNDSIIHILTHSPVFYKAYCLFSSVREVDIQSPFTHNGC